MCHSQLTINRVERTTRMFSNWRQVPIDQAQRHPLYGVGGWLLVFAVGLLLGFMKEVGAVRGEAYKAGLTIGDLLSIDDPAVSYLKLAFGLQFLIIVVIYWLLFSKHPSFRKVTTGLLLGGWPAATLLGLIHPFPGLGEALGLGFLSWAFSCAVWVTYLQRSQRVRITFEHCIAASASDHSQISSRPAVAGPFGTPALASSAEIAPPHHSSMQPQPATTPEEELWAIAAQEMDSQGRRAGLWAKAFAEAQGNEPAARANYLKWRVLQLQHEFESRRKQAEEAQRATEEQGQQAALTELGQCPNCDAVISLMSDECPKCRANFGPGSSWKPVPVKT